MSDRARHNRKDCDSLHILLRKMFCSPCRGLLIGGLTVARSEGLCPSPAALGSLLSEGTPGGLSPSGLMENSPRAPSLPHPLTPAPAGATGRKLNA
jgi:hypothetical protein